MYENVISYKIKLLKASNALNLIQLTIVNDRNAYILFIHIIHNRTLFCEHIYSVILWQQYLIHDKTKSAVRSKWIFLYPG